MGPTTHFLPPGRRGRKRPEGWRGIDRVPLGFVGHFKFETFYPQALRAMAQRRQWMRYIHIDGLRLSHDQTRRPEQAYCVAAMFLAAITALFKGRCVHVTFRVCDVGLRPRPTPVGFRSRTSSEREPAR